MMKKLNSYILLFTLVGLLSSCTEKANVDSSIENNLENHHKHNEVVLSKHKAERLNIYADTLQKRIFEGVIYANGRLEVPPQHEAAITAIFGGNVSSILVMEGEEVKKDQVLAYLKHPNFIELQTNYAKVYQQNNYLSFEVERQKQLLQANISSDRAYQKLEAEFLSNKIEMQGLEAQLSLLNLNLNRIQNGDLYTEIAVKSPINGSVEEVSIKLGQFVQPESDLFKIMNTEHVHADFMVFEKDVPWVQKGQMVEFTVSASPHPIQAKIISVGKRFEEAPRAVHIHADIEDEHLDGLHLVSGMYIQGKIFTQSYAELALPEEAIILEEDIHYAFVEKTVEENVQEKHYEMVEVKVTKQEKGWVAIQLMEDLPASTRFVQQGAYYLISEMKKGELEHDH